MANSTRFCYLIVTSLLLFSCGWTSKPASEIIAYKYHDFTYELQLKYHTKGRGNVHQLNLSKYEFDESDWIYLNAISGIVNADSLIFTHYQRKTKYPWNQSALKGNVEFTNDSTIKIDLQIPHYNGTSKIQAYGSYEFNGTYKLVVRQDTALFNENDFLPRISQ